MFKRMQKLNAKLDKSKARGERDDDAGPPELAMDDDSSSSESSSSSSESESEGESSSSSSSGSSRQQRPAKRSRNGSAAESDAKRKRAKKDSDDSSAEESSDESEDESSEEEGSDKSSVSPVSPEDDIILRPSVAEALRDCIYIKPGAVAKQGFTHRSCYICPKALLKNQKMIDTHIAGGSHTRRLKRFVTFTEKKLKPEDKRDPREGGRDAPSIVAEIDKSVEVKEEKQIARKRAVREQQREAKHKRIVARKAAKLELKQQKEAAKQAAAEAVAAGGLSKRKRKALEKEAKGEGAAAEDSSVPITDFAVLDNTSTAVIPVPKKQPVKIKKRQPLPPKAERKARRKEKQAVRQTRKYEERKAKRERKAAQQQGGAPAASAPSA